MTRTGRIVSRGRTRRLLRIVGLVSLAALATVGLSAAESDDTTLKSTGKVATVEGLERVSSTTPFDWASSADVVVSATVTDEVKHEPPKSETAFGSDWVGRTVSVTVLDVLWRSPDAVQPAPIRFEFPAWGWFREPGWVDTEVSGSGSSRLDPGHDYVLALRWMEAECSPGDGRYPATWSKIGSGGVLPADDGIIGNGEFEGAERTADDLPPDLPRDAMYALHLGDDPRSVADSLNNAKRKRTNFQQGADLCRDRRPSDTGH